MLIGSIEVQTVPIAPSLYLRLSRLECDPSARTFAILGYAVQPCPVTVPTARDSATVEAFGDAVLDHYVSMGATFRQIAEAAGEVVGEVSRRLGFTKAEVKSDADFSEATGDGSEPG